MSETSPPPKGPSVGLIVLVGLVALLAITAYRVFNEPSAKPQAAVTHTATLTTSKGVIKLGLFGDECPKTVGNFIELVEAGFYDGLPSHRVVPDFMVQLGKPLDNELDPDGPGYRFDDEPSALALKHDRAGTVSMANAGPNTNGSQFFITHKPTDWLDGKHAVFGRVLEGQDVVDAFQVGDTLQKIAVAPR